MRRVLAAAFLLSLLTTASYAQDKQITVSGCVIRGVEPGCIRLIQPGLRKSYDISNAQPTPTRMNTYGRVTGTLRDHWFSPCRLTDAITPAQYTYIGPLCPMAKRGHKR
jgi:hypothetical protein